MTTMGYRRTSSWRAMRLALALVLATLAGGCAVQPSNDAITTGIDDAPFKRLPVAAVAPAPAPAAWQELIGEYGRDHNTLYVYEQDGALFALIEWLGNYRLAEQSPDAFRFPASGVFAGERLVFARNADGQVTAAKAGAVKFERRAVGPESGGIFRITPQRPVAELRREALQASPPIEHGQFRAPDLVELTQLDPTIKLDIRYATSDNFLSTPVYNQPRAFMQRPAAEAVVRVNRALAAEGFGLLVHDAYRPWYVTRIFWEATPASGRSFVADPSQGSRHNRGCAVDLTLYDLRSGQAVDMPGVYDEMSARSYPDYPGSTSLQRWRRDHLREAMEREGFTVYDSEWWHFDYRTWREYPILNVDFELLRGRSGQPVGTTSR
jgi:D-alanyl-D-alanine dipeptidase